MYYQQAYTTKGLTAVEFDKPGVREAILRISIPMLLLGSGMLWYYKTKGDALWLVAGRSALGIGAWSFSKLYTWK